MHPRIVDFLEEKQRNIDALGHRKDLAQLGLSFLVQTASLKYSYNFSWLGVPIIQFPQDMVALQEIIWTVRPDLIIETGVAHGGSLIFHASMLELLGGEGEVIGIDIDIREHNRAVIESHPMFKRITLIEGSSVSDEITNRVADIAAAKQRVMVILDSNHTHEHVLTELRSYAPLVSVGSYCVVFDTVVEDMPKDSFPDRPWGQGDNPKTAVWQYLEETSDFVIDKTVEDKLLITVAPDGYLRRVA